MTEDVRPPLWRQLQLVAALVLSVRQGQSASAALSSVAPALRPGVQALGFAVLRHLGRAQALRQLLAPRAPAPRLDALLCTALALLWQTDKPLYDAFTLVDQAVKAVKRDARLRPQAGFVNACLRGFLRERDALLAQSQRDPLARWNHPQWWIERLQHDWPDHWQAILLADAQQPPMVLRVNARWGTPQAYVAQLRQAGLDGSVCAPQGVQLSAPCPVQQLPGFAQGWVSVQDSGAQIAAPLLLAQLPGISAKGARVLDACAAPGGKTAHLLELSDAAVTALDIDPLRCQRIHQNLARLGLAATVLAADAADPHAWWDGVPFDAILLDAPCSAAGIVRRHPDIVWLRRPTDIEQLVAQQAQLLARLWPLLRPRGHMLYCTCSVFRAEGAGQVAAFLASNTQARQLPAPGHLLPCIGEPGTTSHDNLVGEHDGFYYALLQKTSA
ncbi:MAG: 16S rRNA (cytosine(967)-C(5))-methyltransferase [Comamonadaceae bacterium CG1_02_60_18]|nr:MAG: 16S rRNA (cytosine(967)-C(5))-methyltransferase [Comamonadaceae bacterium CG1_02_60_18]PIQ50541.1 MAG: 16S rRNA (cytosine(967)-C(5))-methyltransferase [Comamonadaceae bacterium CG12_big_fil_rev_8_21_14_0_65_59_15]